jgi:membrane-associated protease RseP (regulator of RpoE activity)
MTPTMARALRVAVVILLGLFGAVQDATEFSLPWNPYSTFGFSSSIDGRINGLQAGSPAAKAGLQDGDRIDVTPLGLHERRRLIYKTIGPPNGRISFSVIAGGKRREISLVSTRSNGAFSTTSATRSTRSSTLHSWSSRPSSCCSARRCSRGASF